MDNFEVSSWDAPGDYSYLVEKYPEDKKPRLMKVKGTDKYFIESVVKDRDPKIDEKYYYRLFKPEDYLPKEMVEWKEDPKFKKEYNAKIFTGYADLEDFSPYGDESGRFIFRSIVKPELMPEKGLSLSDRLDYFMKNDKIFAFDTSRFHDISTKKGSDGRLIHNTREYWEDPETGKSEVNHNDGVFATCGPYVTVKPSSVDNMESWSDFGAKDKLNVYNYLYPSDNGLSLRKTDESDKLLAGSSWKIKNLGTKEEFTVTDNMKPNGREKGILEDLNKDDGIINVALPEGRYEVVEFKAPEGYSVDNTPKKFIIHDRTGASYGLGNVVNKPEKPGESTTPTSEKPGESTTPTTSEKPGESTTPSTSENSTTTPGNGSISNPTTSIPLVGKVKNNPSSPLIPHSPNRPAVEENSENSPTAGPVVNTGGEVSVSFWDKLKNLFS